MLSKNMYGLPLKEESILEWSTSVSRQHIGRLKWAVDFEVPEGTPVYAAADGTVAYVKDDSNIGGADPALNDMGNRITLEHDNDEYSAYEHLRYKGAAVKPGQDVKRGELIGWSGNTGNSTSPHLHFEVFIDPSADKSEGETIEVQFEYLPMDKQNEGLGT